MACLGSWQRIQSIHHGEWLRVAEVWSSIHSQHKERRVVSSYDGHYWWPNWQDLEWPQGKHLGTPVREFLAYSTLWACLGEIFLVRLIEVGCFGPLMQAPPAWVFLDNKWRRKWAAHKLKLLLLWLLSGDGLKAPTVSQKRSLSLKVVLPGCFIIAAERV